MFAKANMLFTRMLNLQNTMDVKALKKLKAVKRKHDNYTKKTITTKVIAKYKIQYVGKSETPFHIRLNNHRKEEVEVIRSTRAITYGV